MQLVEQHVIDQADPRYAIIDETAFKAKNLYNAANYLVRQSFIGEQGYLDHVKVFHLIKGHEAYKALPAKVSNQVLIQVHQAWKSFFEAMEAWQITPQKFLGRPKLPGYKDKTNGRNLLVYEQGAVSKKALKRGMIAPSGLNIAVKTQQQQVKQARIVPRIGFYVLEVIYERQEQPPTGNTSLFASMDLGVNNVAAITSNKPGFHPVLVNGRPLKSTNQYYNKRRAELQKKLGKTRTSKRMENMTNKRNRRVNQYLHTASKQFIALLVQEGIHTLVVGKNPLWKQEVTMGKRNNQQFVQIPHARFIAMLTYKGKLAGIEVRIQEESYTSKASFLDHDAIPTYQSGEKHTFSGKRQHRGLYRASTGRRINADVNGSYNIGRKAVPKSFGHGIEALAVAPVRPSVLTAQPRALTGTRTARRKPKTTAWPGNGRIR
jgi:putative transposase